MIQNSIRVKRNRLNPVMTNDLAVKLNVVGGDLHAVVEVNKLRREKNARWNAQFNKLSAVEKRNVIRALMHVRRTYHCYTVGQIRKLSVLPADKRPTDLSTTFIMRVFREVR